MQKTLEIWLGRVKCDISQVRPQWAAWCFFRSSVFLSDWSGGGVGIFAAWPEVIDCNVAGQVLKEAVKNPGMFAPRAT